MSLKYETFMLSVSPNTFCFIQIIFKIENVNNTVNKDVTAFIGIDDTTLLPHKCPLLSKYQLNIGHEL